MNREPEVDRMVSRGVGCPRLTLFGVISSPPSPHKCVHTLLTISHHAGPSGRRPTGGDIHTVGSLHFHAEKTTPTSQRPEESLRDDGVYEELATC